MAAAFPEIDFHDFHRRTLPELLADGRGVLATRTNLGSAGPLAFRLPDGAAYTYVPREGSMDVVRGDDEARTVIELSHDDWQGLVHDLESAPGLLYSGRASCPRGKAMRFVLWEPILRAMYRGRPPFDPQRVDLRDRDGSPLDVTRTFRLDDDADDLAHFLRTAGYLHVKGVFSPDEVDALRLSADALRSLAVEGDKKSWWARDAEGRAVLCRVTHGGRVRELADLYDDPRLLRLAGLADETLVSRARNTEDGVSLLIKNPGIAEGLSDLPWHRDCGMGGHACMCPILIFSTFLQPSRPETGELRMLPGSHTGTYGFFEPEDPKAPSGVPIAADPGDVSLHYGDIMHAAPAPTGSSGPFRECLLMAFARPDAYNHRGLNNYNDVLLSREDGQVEHLSKVADRS